MPGSQRPTPTISVLMSVRNGLPYVHEAVESIRGQTFSDWEFVIVDNASTDGTPDYLEARAATDPRILVIRSETDLGVATGRNLALAHCRGEWIARMDADDRALPQRFERQLAFVRERPEVKVASCLAYYINADGRRVARTAHDLTTPAAFARYMATNEVIGVLHPGALIERETLVRAGGYRPEFVPAEDIDLWNRISETGAMVLVQAEVLMEYRVHAQSLMARSFREAHMKHQWVEACMKARRAGGAEPGWEEFLAEWQAAPWPLRLDRWRLAAGRQLYRSAADSKISGHLLAAAIEFSLALLLRPAYATRRLRSQLLGREVAAPLAVQP